MPECAICAAERRAAIAAEFGRLGVDQAERHMYAYALADHASPGGYPDSELPHILAKLARCATRADLDSLAERGVIAP